MCLVIHVDMFNGCIISMRVNYGQSNWRNTCAPSKAPYTKCSFGFMGGTELWQSRYIWGWIDNGKCTFCGVPEDQTDSYTALYAPTRICMAWCYASFRSWLHEYQTGNNTSLSAAKGFPVHKIFLLWQHELLSSFKLSFGTHHEAEHCCQNKAPVGWYCSMYFVYCKI